MLRCAVAFRMAVVLTVLGVQGVFGGEPFISIVPIGTGPKGELAAGAVIDGSAITLTTDGVNPVPVFLEIRIGDWDPADAGVTLAGYQPAFDSSSFTTGASGALTVFVGSSSCGECSDNGDPCFSRQECTPGTCSVSGGPCHPPIRPDNPSDCPSGEFCVGAASCDSIVGGNAICEAELGVGALCGPPGYFLGSGTCSFAYIDLNRSDFVLADANAVLPAVDISSADVRPSALVISGPVNDPEPFPAEGLYAATIALLVPPDAQGTFTLFLKPFPSTNLSAGTGPPLGGTCSLSGGSCHTALNDCPSGETCDGDVELIPAQIRVNPGRCCFRLQFRPDNRQRCTDGLTENECADQEGVTFFEADGTCLDPCPEVCGDNLNNQLSEECDGDDAAACPGACQSNCLCAFCGDGVRTGSEECDGADDAACPGLCLGDCSCGFCGDGIQTGSEECDGLDDAACPGLCLGDCSCGPFCGDDVVNQKGEECDGIDDATCLGICLEDCTCNPTCGDVDGDGNADMLGVAIFMNCFTGPGGGPVPSECRCAEFDTDDDIDIDDLLRFVDTLIGP